MAEIWVVLGHSAVIPNNEKWPADIGDGILRSHVRTLTTLPPPPLFSIHFPSPFLPFLSVFLPSLLSLLIYFLPLPFLSLLLYLLSPLLNFHPNSFRSLPYLTLFFFSILLATLAYCHIILLTQPPRS